jgi:UDP-N-acetylmuramoyl-tripeptide--D-alanyl-D-alanine ligase
VDGNEFIRDALEKGAQVVMATRRPSDDEQRLALKTSAALLFVADGIGALQSLASAQRELLTAKVIAVTGSSGKTSTKSLISTVLETAFDTVSSAGNQNNELGLPATVLSAESSTEALVTEMGMRGLGQIAELAHIARPDIGVITNIGQAHLELLGSKENIERAKAELIEALPKGRGIAVLNGDDPYSSRIRELADTAGRDIHVSQFGLGKHNDIRAENISFDEQAHPSFDLWARDVQPMRVSLRLQGQHSIYNALAAVAVGVSLKMDTQTIVLALGKAEPLPMRQKMVTLDDGTLVIDDSYNANPESMRASLSFLAQMDKARLHIAVLGDMAELGPEEGKLHEQIGEYLAQTSVDVLIAVGKLAKHYGKGARAAGMNSDNIIALEDAEEASTALKSLVARQEERKPIILIKASRFMQLDRVVELLYSHKVVRINEMDADT